MIRSGEQMNKLRYFYLEAVVLAVGWTIVAQTTNQQTAMSSYADIISVAVLVVFVQFLFQAQPPAGTANYLRFSYLSLLFAGFALVSQAPQFVILFLSGYVFSLTMVYLLRQIKGA